MMYEPWLNQDIYGAHIYSEVKNYCVGCLRHKSIQGKNLDHHSFEHVKWRLPVESMESRSSTFNMFNHGYQQHDQGSRHFNIGVSNTTLWLQVTYA